MISVFTEDYDAPLGKAQEYNRNGFDCIAPGKRKEKRDGSYDVEREASRKIWSAKWNEEE